MPKDNITINAGEAKQEIFGVPIKPFSGCDFAVEPGHIKEVSIKIDGKHPSFQTIYEGGSTAEALAAARDWEYTFADEGAESKVYDCMLRVKAGDKLKADIVKITIAQPQQTGIYIDAGEDGTAVFGVGIRPFEGCTFSSSAGEIVKVEGVIDGG